MKLRSERVKRLARAAGIIFGLWCLYGILDMGELLLRMPRYDDTFTWRKAVMWSMPDAIIWALLTPIPLLIASRFPIAARHLLRNFGIHIAGFAMVASANVTLDVFQNQLWSGSSMNFPQLFAHILRETILNKILIYAILVFVQQHRDRMRQASEREREASELNARLSAARLEVLEAQLRPHFLFNALNTVAGLVEVDPAGARRLLSDLGELLRRSLYTKTKQVIALREELDVVRAYLNIERERFRERLTTVFDVNDDCLDCLVPAFLLQPLVENAVRHGLAPELEGGTLTVSARAQNGSLEIDVHDSGKGVEPGLPLKEGIGLTNTRARLSTLYGADHRFGLGNDPAGGLRVSIVLPKRTSSGGVA